MKKILSILVGLVVLSTSMFAQPILKDTKTVDDGILMLYEDEYTRYLAEVPFEGTIDADGVIAYYADECEDVKFDDFMVGMYNGDTNSDSFMNNAQSYFFDTLGYELYIMFTTEGFAIIKDIGEGESFLYFFHDIH